MSVIDLLAEAQRLSIDGNVSHTVHAYPLPEVGFRDVYAPRAIQYVERDEFRFRDKQGFRQTLSGPWRVAYQDKCKRCGGIAKGERCYMSPPCS